MFVKFYSFNHLKNPQCQNLRNYLDTNDDFYSSQFNFLTSEKKQIKRQTSRQKGSTSYTHARTRISTRTHQRHTTFSRRSSRQILFRKIGLPLSSTTERRQLCVGGSSRPIRTYQYARNVRACERLKNFRGYHTPIFFSNIQSLPFLFCTRPRYLTNFRYILTVRNDVTHYDRYRQKPSVSEIRVFP